ncbi:MAG: 4-hydroxy-tetrahydrodipicolinate synthase [Clostridia bacterium]|nr:4-hydroxy-tetrahydrodipicolinate synthase [Clostridia bacterium]MBQ3868459.1 4-hydroxy-tetrahydrodipicolinate synthase [Clostridia bacterium]MBR0158456.1 4-hydroxy-tetrahydrodipicolinate synthase [Clostridia bacterium]MBR7062164.1 4-hydroxy-tetrahydrodipicolinate synthase [Clostridia bacterium]
MKKPVFIGAGCAIVTPFKGINNAEVDFDKLGELIEMQIAGHTDAIVICGTTGESSTMPDAEHLSVIEYAVNKVAGRIPVVAGTGSNDTHHGINLSREAVRLGADALLQVTPYYNKATQKGLIKHYSAIAAAVDVPIILYNVPSRTGVNIAPDTLKELSKIPNVNGIKECNLAQVTEVRCKCGDELNIWSGEDGQVTMMLGAGAQGVISVVSNVYPQIMHDMVMKHKNGDVRGSWELQAKTLPLVKALFCEVNPIPVKEALNLKGINVGGCRLPLCEMEDKNRKLLADALKEFEAKL